MEAETCGVCGGDGRINDNEARCPSCHGTGRRSVEGPRRDRTTMDSSHLRPGGGPRPPPAAAEKTVWPTTFEGSKLADEVKACASLSSAARDKMTREIIDHESTHGNCTQTFLKKMRKQLRPAAR